MKQQAVALLVIGLLTSVAVSQADQSEMEKLQGTWKVISMEREGKAAPEDVIRVQGAWIIQGDKIAVGSSKGVRSTYRLDPSKKPKAIDVSSTDPKVKTIPGIYELEGDTLRLCLSYPDNKERPTAFAAPTGSKVSFYVFKREKR
jgi:uncharacterized protein (TIGR03067 family)